MFRKLMSLALFGAMCGAMAYAEDEKKPGEAKKGDGKFAGKMDRSKMFEKMDANGDGKVTKEEYTKFFEGMAERMKDKAGGKGGRGGNMAEMAAKRFDQIDANKDGVITKEEFEKADTFGGRPGGKDGKGRGKGTPPKPADPEKKTD